MASAFSHALVAVALGKMSTRTAMPWRFWWLSMACAILPDADVVGFAWSISYASLLGHRGLSHSLCFALLLGLVVVTCAFRTLPWGRRAWWAMVGYFTVVTASHGVLDAVTNGGLGIAFLAPFDTTRYFFAWRPVQVSPIGISAFFSAWGWRVLQSEALFLWLPTLCLYGVVRLARRVGTAR